MSEDRKVTYQRIGGAIGIIAPLLAFACILVAIASYSAFSWTNNALSDLGVVSGLTGSVFNFGLYGGGFLAFNFALFGLFNYFDKNRLGKLGAAVFAGACIALMAIGVFNEHYSPTHYLVSVAFFALAPIALFVLTAAFGLTHQRRMAAFTFLVAAAAASPWLLEFSIHYVPGVAVPEAVSGLLVSAWVIVLSKKCLSAA